MGEGGQDQAKRIKEFFTALAICHTVIPERSADSDEVRMRARGYPRDSSARFSLG